MGRFISADGYTTTGQGNLGANMFAYCNNTPIGFKDPTGEFLISALIVIGSGVLIGAASGAFMAACRGGDKSDIIEGAIEGALTGGIAATIGFFVPVALPAISATAQTLISGGIGMIAGASIDLAVQAISNVSANETTDFEPDWYRVAETAVSTGISAGLPTFSNTPTDVIDATGTAIVGAEASFIIASSIIAIDRIVDANRRKAITVKEKLYHGL